MSLTYQQAIDQMLTLFKTAWDTTTYQAHYESVRLQRDTTQDPWAEVFVRHTAGYQATLSSTLGSRIFRREGVIQVRIFIAQGSGLSDAYTLAKVVADAYEGARTSGGAWFRNVRVNEVGRDGEFLQVDVTVDFQYDETK